MQKKNIQLSILKQPYWLAIFVIMLCNKHLQNSET